MTKKEQLRIVLNAVVAYATEVKLSEKVVEGLKGILTEHLGPKTGGAKVDLSTVTRVKDGKVTEVQCNVSGAWLPATLEYFYEDKSENPAIIGLDGKGLKRLSRQAESISKKFKATQKASIAALKDDIINLEMTEANAVKAKQLKEELAKVQAAKPDFSKVGILPSKADNS